MDMGYLHKYTKGKCYIFALALKKLVPNLDIKAYTFYHSQDDREYMSHAWCITTDGIKVDASGLNPDIDEEYLESDFVDKITTFEALYEWTDWFFDEYTCEDINYEINEAIKVIKSSKFLEKNKLIPKIKKNKKRFKRGLQK